MIKNIEVPHEEIASFCKRHKVQKLAFFGSVVRDDFSLESDVDVLVEFKPEAEVGLFDLYEMEQELSQILGVRKVDLNTFQSLSRHFRQKILQEAEVCYVSS